MRISFIEIQNFRKLKSVRVDFHGEKTVLVGPNNSGKTSAMLSLGHFLVNPKRFNPNDFTICHWKELNNIGEAWYQRQAAGQPIDANLSEFENLLPSLDIWLEVRPDEVYLVRHIVPTLDWSGGLVGVRLRYEPDVEKLAKEFTVTVKNARDVKKNAPVVDGKPSAITIWPDDLRNFLERHLHRFFGVVAYSLDPAKQQAPKNGVALPQPVPRSSEAIEGNPLKGIMQVNEIAADRGFGGAGSLTSREREDDSISRDQRTLSAQLRKYYANHLDPTEFPEPEDLKALVSIRNSEEQFDEQLNFHFSGPLKELQRLGYPGSVDPPLVLSTQLKTLTALQHKAAVQFQVANHEDGVVAKLLRLPEEYNGLGYQNLIYIVFQLMRFRDAWLQIGKAAKRAVLEDDVAIAPLHLVLIEEPEAHLHAQVQQVFIREAYAVLGDRPELKSNPSLHTQLVVSTHSSHVTHECKFNCLRYFRRQPGEKPGDIPFSTVINLSETFGPDEETPRFVTRYLTSMHSDLFFADAAVFVEGSAEGILIPHFIEARFKELNQRYITLLEIGGSHAHRLRTLVEDLGLTTLIVTDIDAVDASGKSVPTEAGKALETGNPTLKQWCPAKTAIDELLSLKEDEKIKYYSRLFSIRVAYQYPEAVQLGEGTPPISLAARTFEDALIFRNLEFFRKLDPTTGAVEKFRKIVAACADPQQLPSQISEVLKDVTKAGFALDLLFSADVAQLDVPAYLSAGLDWLQQELQRKQGDIVPPVTREFTKEEA